MHICIAKQFRVLFHRSREDTESRVEKMDRWVGKTAIITGASSGIGKALVELLVAKGLKVVGIARRIDTLKTLAEELKSKPGKLFPLRCDLSKTSEIFQALEWTKKNLGTIDLLVNNAAINIETGFLTGGIEEWEKTFDVNLLGLTCITKEVLKFMKTQGIDNGCIIMINDTLGLRVPTGCDRPAFPAYTASKFALTAICDSLRLELAQLESNIKVTCICPGLVETEMTEQWLKENPRLALKPKDVADVILLTLQTPDTLLIKDLVITPIRELL